MADDVSRDRGEGGASALEWVGIVVIAAALMAGVLAFVSEGRVVAAFQYAACRLVNGACADPNVPTGMPVQDRCELSPTGPLGSPRITYRVDLGGRTVTVDEMSGGGFRVVYPEEASEGATLTGLPLAAPVGTGVAAVAGTARSSVYFADSDADLAQVLTGLRRRARQEALFGTGGAAASDAWAATGGLLFDLAGEPPPPTPNAQYTGSSAAFAPSANAYAYALAVGSGAATETLGHATVQGGATTEYIAARTTWPGSQYAAVEIVRDARGYVTEVRATTGTSVSAETIGVPVVSSESATAARGLLDALGVTSPVLFSYPLGTTSPGAGAITEFRAAGLGSGYVSRVPGGTMRASGGATLPLGSLGTAMREARSSAPVAEQWNGTGWQVWAGCR